MTDTSHDRSYDITVSPDDPVFSVENFDTSVRPEDDFYRFVNGGWLDANPVPEEYGAWGAFQELAHRNEDLLHDILERVAAAEGDLGAVAELVGTYYASGMATDVIESRGLSPIEPLLGAVASVASHTDLPSVLADLHRSGIAPLFGYGVQPDFDDATAYLLYLGQGGLGLPDRDYYLRDDDTSTALLEAYRAHVARMFDLIGDDDAAEGADAVLRIEKEIAEASYTNVQMRDISLIANKRSLADLATATPTLRIREFLENLGGHREKAYGIDNVGFFPAIDELVASTPIADIRTYLRWNIIRSVASALPEHVERANFDFYGTTLGGQKALKPRWKRVLAAATSDIGHAVARLFVDENFSPEAKERMEHLVENLFAAMRDRLLAVAWMGDETRAEALAKLDGFGHKIGYPDEWRDYTGLEVVRDAWFENRLAAARFEADRQLGLLGSPVDPHDWSMPAHVVNAYYHPLRNEIVFPAGILQPPFFSLDADDASNYGAIGAVIGHEITHGFDDQGSHFDAEGNVRDWWSEEDRTEFERRARVLVEQFDAYEVEPGLHVNGELTLGENIADIGGLKIALAALDAELGDAEASWWGLTAHQRFYIAWTTGWRRNYTDEYLRLLVNSDPHSPSHFRSIGPLSNLQTFTDAFGLTAASPAMRPRELRVDIW